MNLKPITHFFKLRKAAKFRWHMFVYKLNAVKSHT
jgi:hypothetical protein